MSVSSSPEESVSHSNSLSSGAVAGIVIGIAAFAAVVVGLIYCMYCARPKGSSISPHQPTKPSPMYNV
jgi:hypothetical protein